MIRGLYTSGWSMMANNKKMDVISNNIANVNTTAYKKDTVVFESFPALLTRRINDSKSVLNPSGKIGDMELSSDVGEVFTYYNQGQFENTGDNFDMAITGSDTAFFTVEVADRDGNVKEYYTRDGAFAVNADNQLVTKDGYIVAGEEGPIVLNGGDFKVESDGTVVENGEIAGKLRITQFEDGAALRKYGESLVEATGDAVESEFTGTVSQGYLEQSNVNIIREMVEMITVMRAYEANQKIIQAQDGTLEKVVNEVGALS